MSVATVPDAPSDRIPFSASDGRTMNSPTLREPLLELRRLFLFRAEHLRGRFQRRHAHREHVDHVDRAADDGQSHPLVLLAERLGLLVVHHHRLVWAAHRDGNRVRPLHHDAFENSLSANIDGLLGLIRHNNTSFCACARTMRSSRRKAENPPPSYIRDKRARFLQRRREKRNKEGIDMERKDAVSCKQGNYKKRGTKA